MEQDKDMTEKIESILNSLDGIKLVDAPAFFYTRLSAGMENNTTHKQAVCIRCISKPAFAIAILLVFAAANGLAINHLIKQNKTETSSTASIQNFTEEYGLSTASVY